MFDVTLDYSIGKFLRLEHSETHILVAGMEFGRKIRLLCELLKHSDHPKKQQLVEQLSILQAAKRDAITHAYVASNSTDITFIYRSRGGPYEAKELRFTYPEFKEHVTTLIEAAQRYQRMLGAPVEELLSFANTVLSLKKRS
ncbi:MAG: hypothetical protein CTR53_20540 [Ferrovibrio sp.]|nr:MAG: hypothetical protein CTR53_20540 [Ferrovibrio sp.]